MQQAPRPLTIPAVLDHAASTFPDRLAYVDGERRVTWGEVATLADKTCAGLVALGLKPGDRAAICAENSIDWIIAYHAIVRAGAAAALVYFELAPREIEEQIRRPACRLLFASASVLSKITLPDCVEHVILLGEEAPEASTPHMTIEALQIASPLSSQARPEPGGRGEGAGGEVPPDSLAAIIYTSGTTGGAKGVMLSHRNLTSNAHAVLEV
ncbi:MAG TPA: AMP-binding protein, partial [Dehalococcoidia bacterium]|nr:AMP-binding protein [Dehalococcoidia bacterium]